MAAVRSFWIECRTKPLAMLKLCVPGLAYTIQNNLIFLSVDFLSAAVQQVTYQLKMLSCSYCLLFFGAPLKLGVLLPSLSQVRAGCFV